MCWAGNDRGAVATELRLQAKTNRPNDRPNQKKDEQRKRAECPAVQQCFSEGIAVRVWVQVFSSGLSAHFSTRLDSPEPSDKHHCEDLRG